MTSLKECRSIDYVLFSGRHLSAFHTDFLLESSVLVDETFGSASQFVADRRSPTHPLSKTTREGRVMLRGKHSRATSVGLDEKYVWLSCSSHSVSTVRPFWVQSHATPVTLAPPLAFQYSLRSQLVLLLLRKCCWS